MRKDLIALREARRKRHKDVGPPVDLKLFDHQIEMTTNLLKAFDSGQHRIYGKSPTGSGKTYMMMYMIDAFWKRGNSSQRPSAERERGQVLILVPTISIAAQIMEEAQKVLRGKLKHRCRIELEQGDARTTGEADVTVATWHGLHRSEERLIKFDPLFFELVIVDECHHAASPCFLRLLQYFNEDVTLCPESDPIDGYKNGHKVKLLGLSATPDRKDGYFVENAFPHRAHVVEIEDLMDSGRLTKILYTAIDGDLDIEDLLKYGDHEEGDEEEEDFEPEEDDQFTACNKAIIRQHKMRHKYDDRRHTLVFCKRLRQVWSLKAAFKRAGVVAEAISGKTPKEARRRLLKQFKAGVYPCLINCGTLVEGTDLPCIDLLIIAKPTKSEIMYMQMVGRGLRNSVETGKLNCLVVDFTVSESTGIQICAELDALVEHVPRMPDISNPASQASPIVKREKLNSQATIWTQTVVKKETPHNEPSGSARRSNDSRTAVRNRSSTGSQGGGRLAYVPSSQPDEGWCAEDRSEVEQRYWSRRDDSIASTQDVSNPFRPLMADSDDESSQGDNDEVEDDDEDEDGDEGEYEGEYEDEDEDGDESAYVTSSSRAREATQRRDYSDR